MNAAGAETGPARRAGPAGPRRGLRPEWIAALLLLSAYVAVKHSFGILICDDAYITLSHARSWNHGLGPVMSAWNPVCATSTPLHTLVLALAGCLSRSQAYPAFAYWTNAVWDLIGFFYLYRLARGGLGMRGPWALIALGGYALSINALAVSASGMEAPMYVALALAGTWYALYADHAMPFLAIISLLAPLTRPEGILLPAVLILMRRRRMSGFDATARMAAGAAALGLALFFAFNLYAYGRPLPHSILAKRMEIHIGFVDGLRAWMLNVFYKGPTFGGARAITLANALILVGAVVGYLRRRNRNSPSVLHADRLIPWQILVWPAVYFAFFMATRSSYVLFTWYYLPVLPFLFLFLCAGLERLADKLLPPTLEWALFFGFLACVPAQTFRQHLPQKHVLLESAREGRYREAARIVDSLALPGHVPMLMTDEVGAIGYWSHARILDTHGLLSPEALPYLGPPENYFLRMQALQNRFDPDWIMGLRLAKDEGLLSPGEDGMYSGYAPTRILRLEPHPYNMEMWHRLAPD